MNKKKMLLTLAVGMMLGGCDNQSKNEKNGINENVTDTMLVIGVWNQPYTHGWNAEKDFVLVNKRGNRYKYRAYVYGKNGELRDVSPYVERGDTLYIENGRIVKNLTMEYMAERYVNGR